MKSKHINIGNVFFAIIFIYLIATVIIYISTSRVSVYEVRQGSILKDNSYTGFAIRDETVVFAENDGYVNYFIEEESKVRVGTKIYTVSNEKLTFADASEETEINLTESKRQALILKIQEYNSQFHDSDFASTYQFKNSIQDELNKSASQSKAEQLKNMLTDDNSSGISVNTAAKDGIIVYSVDGMEDVTLETITTELLHKSNYKKAGYANNKSIQSGEPVYKLITDDKWHLIVEISNETKESLLDKKTVKVKFKSDNQETRANLSFMENLERPVICLSFNDSMIRYANERYLDVELILEDQAGLKIPKSAETSKEFYVVPKSYLTQGGNSSSDGVMRRRVDSSGKEITEFLQVTVYNEEDDMVYLNPNEFEAGDILLKTDSNETYPLKEKRSLPGVFCVNKGYAVFKQIKILCESSEYYIIAEGSDFGLSNYDHIALDSSGIKEDDVVF